MPPFSHFRSFHTWLHRGFQIKVQPRRLYILVGCLLLVDVAFLLTWHIMDPLYRDIESFPLEDPHNTQEDIKFKPLLEHCYCRNITTWLGGKTEIL